MVRAMRVLFLGEKAPLSKGDSPLRGEMSRSDRGARARRAGTVRRLGDSDAPYRIARHTRRRPGIPPPRLRSAPPFDKGGFFLAGFARATSRPLQGRWPSVSDGRRGFTAFTPPQTSPRRSRPMPQPRGRGCRSCLSAGWSGSRRPGKTRRPSRK